MVQLVGQFLHFKEVLEREVRVLTIDSRHLRFSAQSFRFAVLFLRLDAHLKRLLLGRLHAGLELKELVVADDLYVVVTELLYGLELLSEYRVEGQFQRRLIVEHHRPCVRLFAPLEFRNLLKQRHQGVISVMIPLQEAGRREVAACACHAHRLCQFLVRSEERLREVSMLIGLLGDVRKHVEARCEHLQLARAVATLDRKQVGGSRRQVVL